MKNEECVVSVYTYLLKPVQRYVIVIGDVFGVALSAVQRL